MSDARRGWARTAYHHNVYGYVVASRGLGAVYDALNLAADWETRRIQDNLLCLDAEVATLRSEPDEGDAHVLYVRANGSLEVIIAFVWRLSAALAAAGIEHNFEVYEARDRYVALIPPDSKL